MNLITYLFQFFLLITLLSLSFCSYTYNVEDVSEWKKTDITNKGNFDVNYYINDNYVANQQSLQLTDSKIVVVTYGYLDFTNRSKYYYQIAIYDNQGNQIKSKTIEIELDVEQVELTITNVEGEFALIYSTYGEIYMSFYNQNLEINRGIQDVKLTEGFVEYPIISYGKNLLYMIFKTQSCNSFCANVLILDLSDISTYSTLKNHIYYDYELLHTRAYTIQAFKDDTAILYFYGIQGDNSAKLIQALYSSNGEQISGYPKELEIFLDLVIKQQYYPWRSILHSNEEFATFFAADKNNSLQVYTYSKNGDEVCSKTIDFTGYDYKHYFYGIIEEQGWAYIKNESNEEGHFVLFNPEQCSLDLTSIGDGTGLVGGVAGSFLDYDNEKILMFEFGNIFGTQQVSAYANLYQIGSAKLNVKNDDDNDYGSSIVLGIQTMTAILVTLFLI